MSARKQIPSICLTVLLAATGALAQSKTDETTGGWQLTKRLLAYPMTTCLVTDRRLNSMGNAYVHEHEGRLVLFCCRDCVHKFNKESEKYLKKLNKAIVVKQRPDIRNPIPERCDAVHSSAEGEATVALRINAAVAQYVGMNHPPGNDLDPPALFA